VIQQVFFGARRAGQIFDSLIIVSMGMLMDTAMWRE